MKTNFYTENTKEIRLFLEQKGFKPLSFYQGKTYIAISISNIANSKNEWKELDYYTFDQNSKEFSSYRFFSNAYFINKINESIK